MPPSKSRKRFGGSQKGHKFRGNQYVKIPPMTIAEKRRSRADETGLMLAAGLLRSKHKDGRAFRAKMEKKHGKALVAQVAGNGVKPKVQPNIAVQLINIGIKQHNKGVAAKRAKRLARKADRANRITPPTLIGKLLVATGLFKPMTKKRWAQRQGQKSANRSMAYRTRISM